LNISELTQVKVVLSLLFQLLPIIGSPFEIACSIYSQQLNYMHMKIQAYAELIWHVWLCEEVHRVIHSNLCHFLVAEVKLCCMENLSICSTVWKISDLGICKTLSWAPTVLLNGALHGVRSWSVTIQ